MGKGDNLVRRINDNCKITIKLINYSPKRSAHLQKVKDRIKNDHSTVPGYYTTLAKQVLNLFVTRWTV